MPELPEVEIIKLGLEKKIIGLKIQNIQVLSPKSFIGDSDLAEGRKVLKVWRKAKILGVDLSTSFWGAKRLQNQGKEDSGQARMTLLIHLKMSGQLVWKGESGKGKGERFIGGHPTEDMLGKMPNSHTRVIFTFETSHLYFNDQRKFGWIKVVDRLQVTGDRSIKNLGPEPLEKKFTWQVLKQNLLRHKGMPVKVAIMDQAIVSGVGNIYANEACFDAKIDPRTKVGSMSDGQFKRLHEGIIKSLQAGIKYGGSTRVHFVDAEGHKGYFLDYAFVYWRDKHPCKVCGTEIKKISLGGRGTYLCPVCQPA
ncbi:DNA-formamidopyrimidine glycosylase [Candidatus Daviesbacteria bacterium RIFCSPHIGHO2_02_FULL_41_10]|uniref:DNA-formamidopyrimidine glycosylase n=2 Tax=Candidatus Daviesiibacteriota TaxID=1752718 RepID=A0A1F5IR21_9BACT|nr:MAG: DNA-formamidopyrimidine glycosylase [Candidatus Daviesbacteria bacterium RIFCSPHIGHO2_01_FULL_41_23]OGE33065.1 MAG: DNA-formamidopyrimidine glycosylase [Candidatus Daviesbacteria bacterium RIFCSPHIGHO2_02_FULL_41_10]